MPENIFVSGQNCFNCYGVLSGLLNQIKDVILNSYLPELGSFTQLASPLR
jgi:hypothetical protein